MKRILSCLLVLAMLLALAPVSVRATDSGDMLEDEWGDFPSTDSTDSSGNTTSGTCGENLTWTLDSGSVLTISGTGDMDFGYDGCPWYNHLYNITSVVMEEGVTSIEDYAFNRCENMTTVTIPDSVTSIGQYAFGECYSLREVSISRNVTSIGYGAFQFCTRLTGIKVAAGNPNYSSDSMGALYNKAKTELIRVPGGLGGAFVVPNTVTTIASCAFHDCAYLYEVALSDSVTSIGLSAFLFCKNLSKITIPASVTSIDDYAFGTCQNLTKITFKGDAPSIGTDAFMNVTATAYYPAGNTTWTDAVKKNYGGTITWEPYVVTIASGTCGENLTWTLDSAGTLTISGTGPMDNYSYDYFQGSDIPWYEHMASINKVVIEDGATTIGDYAFFECGTLTSVSIPSSVTTIGRVAFSNCRGLTSIALPNSVRDIGEGAFNSCTALTGITIPDGVKEIKKQTFLNCIALSSVTIPDSVTTIGSSAFNLCYSLTSVVIPEGVTTIGDMAFQECTGLTSVTFPSTLTYIGRSAFAYCCDLPSVTIPASVTTIEDHAFSFCNILEGIWVDEGNEFFSSDDRGVLFNKDQTVLLVAPDGMHGEYAIPDSVKTIGYYAFYRCNNLTGITIPDSVTAIDREAFGICEGLTSITIPESVTSIGESAFYWCAINEIIFEGDAPSIAERAFSRVTATAYYPAGNATWTEEVMQDYSGTITWEPYAVTVASGTCGDNLTWTLDSAGTLTISGTGPMELGDNDGWPWHGYEYDGVPYDNLSQDIITVVLENGVTSIDQIAFYNCENLTSVTIPNSVTSIGYNAFAHCSLTSITIPTSVTSIDEFGFGYCANLTEITFEGDAPDIHSRAFYSVTATASYPAGNATWTEETKQNYGGTITWEPYVVTVASGTCGENLTWTLDSAGTLTISGTGPMDNYSYDYFQGSNIPWYEHMASINKVVIEDGATTIGDYAFFECGTLTSVSIPDSVTVIGNMAFSNCRGLTSITIPDSVTVIGEYGFSTCTALTSITIPDGVTTIGERTFAHCTALTSVTIPDSVTTIGTAAFDGCESLMSVVIPEGVTTIGDMAFTNCFSLTSVTFPSTLTHIGTYAFAYCCDLPSVTIPASVTTIEDHAFSFCNILEGIWVDEGNEFFSSDDRGVLFNRDQTVLLVAPDGMHGEYAIPDSVKTIGYYAFYRCNNLTGITIPDSVTAIDREAFGICEGLTSITIPESVTSIGEAAFYWCAINEITFEGDAPSFAERAFSRVTATAYYPAGNATWTEEVMQDYSGTITWVPIGEEMAFPTLTLKYPTLSFESEINYNIYFTVEDAEVAVEDLGLITWYTRPASAAAATYDTAEYVIPGAVHNSAAGEYMVKSQGIPAMRMGDDLYLRVYAKLADGTYAYSAVTYYSAKAYADTILATSDNDAMKALCVAMLNYGASAQTHFGHNTDNLMNAHLTEEQQALAEKWSEEMMREVITPDSAKTVNFVSNGGFPQGYPSVSFDGAFAINYFFTAKQTPDTDILLYCWDEETYLAESVLTEENAVRVVPMKETAASGQYMAAYSGIPAKNIGKTLFVAAVYQTGDVRYSSPVVAYSLGAYCQDRIDNGSDTMKALARETAVYGWYAENYFNK